MLAGKLCAVISAGSHHSNYGSSLLRAPSDKFTESYDFIESDSQWLYSFMNQISTTSLLACAVQLGTLRFRRDIDDGSATTWEDEAYRDSFQHDVDLPPAEVHGRSRLPAELRGSARAQELVAELVSVHGFTQTSQLAELPSTSASIQLRGPLDAAVNNGQGYYEMSGDYGESEEYTAAPLKEKQ